MNNARETKAASLLCALLAGDGVNIVAQAVVVALVTLYSAHEVVIVPKARCIDLARPLDENTAVNIALGSIYCPFRAIMWSWPPRIDLYTPETLEFGLFLAREETL